MRQAVAVANQPPQSIQQSQQLAGHLEAIRLQAALKANVSGAQPAEQQTVQRDQGFIPQGGQSPQPAAVGG
jgi:hypothetical protein